MKMGTSTLRLDRMYTVSDALTPLVASLIFATSRALGLSVEENRAELIAAVERDDLFAFKTGEPMPDNEMDPAALWGERYARLDPGVRQAVVREAVARLKAR